MLYPQNQENPPKEHKMRLKKFYLEVWGVKSLHGTGRAGGRMEQFPRGGTEGEKSAPIQELKVLSRQKFPTQQDLSAGMSWAR